MTAVLVAVWARIAARGRGAAGRFVAARTARSVRSMRAGPAAAAVPAAASSSVSVVARTVIATGEHSHCSNDGDTDAQLAAPPEPAVAALTHVELSPCRPPAWPGREQVICGSSRGGGWSDWAGLFRLGAVGGLRHTLELSEMGGRR